MQKMQKKTTPSMCHVLLQYRCLSVRELRGRIFMYKLSFKTYLFLFLHSTLDKFLKITLMSLKKETWKYFFFPKVQLQV